jgi:hypothetical protein
MQAIGCRKYLSIIRPAACTYGAVVLRAYADTAADFTTAANTNIFLHRPTPSLAPNAPFPQKSAGIQVSVEVDSTIVVLVNPSPIKEGVPGVLKP